MKEKIKKFGPWIPTAIMFIIVIVLIFNIISDADLLKKDNSIVLFLSKT